MGTNSKSKPIASAMERMAEPTSLPVPRGKMMTMTIEGATIAVRSSDPLIKVASQKCLYLNILGWSTTTPSQAPLPPNAVIDNAETIRH
jgi:hypothetical protein